METKNETTVMGLVPRAVALAVALVITFGVATPFVTAAGNVAAEFRHGPMSDAFQIRYVQAH